MDQVWLDEMRKLSREGTVVHVLPRLSLFEFLVLDQICRAKDLPPISMVTGAGRYAFWPLRWLLAWLWRRCRTCEASEVTAVTQAGQSSLLFLRPSRRAGQKKGNQYAAEATEALVRLQRNLDRPLILVPHNIFVGRRRHGSSRSAFWSWWLQQLREGPGLLRLVAQVARQQRTVFIRNAKPISLQELISEREGAEDEELAQIARFELRRRIEQVRKVVLGPMAKSAETIRDEVLRNVILNDEMRAIATREGVPKARLEKRARKLLKEIMAVPKSGYLAALNMTLWWVWSRLFDDVEVDQEGLQRWREVALDGPLVIVSSHKSHVDYLILSQLLWESGIFPPHIAAGKNLSFWPIGAVFRGCGAFFIRRRFMDDALYVAVMRAYITKILQEGYHLEFFIEGTRSRSGKVLPPKLGLLGMVVDAARRLKGYNVRIAPVSVTYGRVPEEGAHVRELAGGEKKSEDLGGLLRTRHTLGKRHGTIYVNFGEPLDVARYFEEQGVTDVDTLEGDEKRRIVSNLAYRTVHEINKVTLITPSAIVASVLLLNRRRGMTHSVLRTEVDRLAACLHQFGGQFSKSLEGAGEQGVREPVLRNAIKFLSDAGPLSVYDDGEDPIYTVAPERRAQLDYYKNQTLHPLVPAMMVATALGKDFENGRDLEELAIDVQFLSRLFKFEFIFRADAVFEVNLEQTIDQLVKLGHLSRVGGRVETTTIESRRLLKNLVAMVEPFLESYRIALREVRQLGDAKVSDKDLVKQALARGERMYLVGEVELYEARSKLNFQNAFKALRDLGVLEQDEARLSSVAEAYRDPEELTKLERRLVSFLRRR